MTKAYDDYDAINRHRTISEFQKSVKQEKKEWKAAERYIEKQTAKKPVVYQDYEQRMAKEVIKTPGAIEKAKSEIRERRAVLKRREKIISKVKKVLRKPVGSTKMKFVKKARVGVEVNPVKPMTVNIKPEPMWKDTYQEERRQFFFR